MLVDIVRGGLPDFNQLRVIMWASRRRAILPCRNHWACVIERVPCGGKLVLA
jgi:hypothetical protein